MRTSLFISAIIAFTNLAQAIRLQEPQLAQIHNDEETKNSERWVLEDIAKKLASRPDTTNFTDEEKNKERLILE